MFNNNLISQTINIDSTFTADAEIYPFSPNDTIYGLSISGSIELNSDTSLIRVILVDEDYNEYMVYEAYPMIVTETHYDITNVSDETCYLNEKVPTSIKIHVVNGQIDLESILLSEDYYSDLEELQYQEKRNNDAVKINNMNSYIQSKGWEWIADSTEIVKEYYSYRKEIFGEGYNMLGLEYYYGGRYIDVMTELVSNIAASDFVLDFDWRNKHDATESDSRYWDLNSDNSGWMTGVVDQNPCGSCAIFGTVAVLESLINLYFNYHIDVSNDLRLSEKDAFNCSRYDNNNPSYVGCLCNDSFGKKISWVLNYIQDYGIVNEECWPYVEPDYCYGMGEDCSDFEPNQKCETPAMTVSITGREVFYLGSASQFELSKADFLKSKLIEHGPLIITIGNWKPNQTLSEHVVALVGFETDEYGRIYWIFKNSYGPGWGLLENGYCKMALVLDPELPYSGKYIKNSIYIIDLPMEMHPLDPFTPYKTRCLDADDDGYFNWGLCDREEDTVNHCYCEPGTPVEEDSNDDDPRIGPFDNYYHGTPISPLLRVKCEDQIISNGGFYSFYDEEIPSAQDFEIEIENLGDAQLNLYDEDNSSQADITFSGPSADNFSITVYPELKIPMQTQDELIIYYDGQASGQLECQVTIAIDEIDIDDFTFTIIHENCNATIPDPVFISGNVNWDDDWEIIHGDTYVQNGACLTITGNYGFGEFANIFVVQGGCLIIDGGHLTKACDALWPGIDVWGHYNQSQQPKLNQGYIKVINDGTIEFAEVAIETIQYQGGEHSFSTSGGIVKAQDAQFKDNIIDVYLYPYNNFNPVTEELLPNASRFKNVQFITTGLICNPESHMVLHDVHGVVISGCKFKNLSNANACPIQYDEGKGIYSFNSDFYVKDYCINTMVTPCPETNRTEFHNLDYGIYALASRPIDYIEIDTCIFENNRTGIYLSGLSEPVIISNSFHVRKVDTTSNPNDIYGGIYLDYCTGYQVEENQFYTYWGTDELEDRMSIGIAINNSGVEYNEIYNNYFSQLYIGILAQNKNRRSDGQDGLVLRCNDNLKNVYDFAVTTCWSNANDFGIRDDQGSSLDDPKAPASNIFGYSYNPNIGNNYSDFYNECASINYYHHGGQQSKRIIPLYFDDDFLYLFLSGYNEEFNKLINCPSNLNPVGSIPDMMMQQSIAENSIDSVQNILNQLVDGGNTDNLNIEVQSSTPPELNDIRSELLSKSPYLSDTVMISTVNKEDVLPSAVVTEILTANPQSAKSNDVMDAVDNRSNSLTDEMIDQIEQGVSIISAKEALESSHSFFSQRKTNALNWILRFYKSDTITPSTSNDSIITIFDRESKINSRYRLAIEYLFENDTINAWSTLDSIPSTYNLNSQQINEHDHYEDFMEVLFEVYNTSRNILQLDSSEKSTFYNIEANSNGFIGAYARNILQFSDTLNYTEQYILPQAGQKMEPAIPSRQSSEIEQKFLVYPNPAQYLIIIEKKCETERLLLNIYNQIGSIVESIKINDMNYLTILDIEDYKPGIYLFNFMDGHKILESHKIIISR